MYISKRGGLQIFRLAHSLSIPNFTMHTLVLFLVTALGFSPFASAGLLYTTSNVIVDDTPTSVRPYILPNLYGTALQLGDDVFRILVSNKSAGGASTVLGTNGQLNSAVPAHNHHLVFENFFCFKGPVVFVFGLIEKHGMFGQEIMGLYHIRKTIRIKS